jgi:hypothetical protein
MTVISTTWKAICIVLTLALMAGAIAIGGGVPLSPGAIARSTTDAARNSRIAARNTLEAARRTEALGRIARNVGRQVAASQRLLRTQLRIEESTAAGVGNARQLTRDVSILERTIRDVEDRLADLSSLSSGVTASSRAAGSAAGALDSSLDALEVRFAEVVRQSRRLNRKARGYEQLTGGLP